MNLEHYFKEAVSQKASDLHLVAGNKPYLRVDGKLIATSNDIIDHNVLLEALKVLVGQERLQQFQENKELDFSTEIDDYRFRINLHYQEGKIGMSARLIKSEVPKPNEIGFNESIINLTKLRDGLILVTGPSGCGKSTTLATMINLINESRRVHIITIEDPIEYIFSDSKSVVEQREVGADTHSFAAALKHVLRQDPNVIMIGEMRDAETMSAALTAAETGHLVLSTLHTITAPETIGRIVDSFPAHRKQQILTQLSLALRAVVAQQLLPKIGGGLIAAREIMINNQAIANLITTNKVAQISTVIKTSYKEGMMDMNKAVDELKENGLIDELTAQSHKRDLSTKAMYYS
ncbi:MAG: PilT/PilU family type 4a pilus ATPase [bacterium]